MDDLQRIYYYKHYLNQILRAIKEVREIVIMILILDCNSEQIAHFLKLVFKFAKPVDLYKFLKQIKLPILSGLWVTSRGLICPSFFINDYKLSL